ncbi:MAG: 3-dehydroquinate synthase, partial [Syntrophomonas sp.]|nr:3-dehydroquinate synthase [Syntrophomonas sp.]
MRVELGDRSYNIEIGSNWLIQLIEKLHFIPKTSRIILITDENVFHLAGDRLLNILRQADFQLESAVIAGGEGCKNLATTAGLHEQMVEFGLDRKSTVLALGGGIVGDIAGF